MSRASFDQYLLSLAAAAASRATCRKRSVGAVVADVNRHIKGTGYNGAPVGSPHCIDSPCSAVNLPAPHSHIVCDSVHAEVNALLSAGASARGGTLAVTTSPCKACAAAIANAGVARVIYAEENRLFRLAEYGLTPEQILINAGIQYELIT